MFELEKVKETPEGYKMKIHYTLMFGENRSISERTFKSKEDAMKYYISCALTILDLRIEEFKIITLNRILPNFTNQELKPYIGKDAELESNVYKLKTFLEKVYGRRDHIHGFVSEIIDNIYLFDNVVIHHKKFTFEANNQRKLITQITTVSKHVKEAYEKLHKAQMKEWNEEPETVGDCKTLKNTTK